MTRFAVPLTVLLVLSFAALSVVRDNGLRVRLLEVARASERLRREARPLPEDLARVYVMTGHDTAPAARHAMLEEIEAYHRVRPWEASYALGKPSEYVPYADRARPRGAGSNPQPRAAATTPPNRAAPPTPAGPSLLARFLSSAPDAPLAIPEHPTSDVEMPPRTWPRLGDAAGLRTLLGDPDGAVRSLAAEALATLHQAEDVPRLAALLGDPSPGAVTLGWSYQMNAVVLVPGQPPPRFWTPEDPVPSRTWEDRTVAASARAGLTLMTGERFESQGNLNEAFQTWWKNNDLGEDAVWFWQRRLDREQDEVDAVIRGMPAISGEAARRAQAFDIAWEPRRKEIVRDLGERPVSVRAKIDLATEPLFWSGNSTGAINVFFAEGLSSPLTADEILELLDRSPDWRDVAAESRLRSRVLSRLSRLVEQGKLPVRDSSAVRQRLSRTR